MCYGTDVYSSPGKHGLEIIGAIEWDDEPYQFDMTAVWRDVATGDLYWADDSGCSCPSPFEDYTTREKLTPGTPDVLNAHLTQRSGGTRAVGEVADLMQMVMKRP